MVAQGKGQGAGVKIVSAQICSFCWFQANPRKVPHRVQPLTREPCCECGEDTNSGIYVRRPAKPPVVWLDE